MHCHGISREYIVTKHYDYKFGGCAGRFVTIFLVSGEPVIKLDIEIYCYYMDEIFNFNWKHSIRSAPLDVFWFLSLHLKICFFFFVLTPINFN